MRANWSSTTKMVINLLKQSPMSKPKLQQEIGVHYSINRTLYDLIKRGNIKKVSNTYYYLND